ncbi:MAG: hypothetical protein JJU36_18065 [Phycisphaeraceae bacterium]|nr:hypothetical protein [Phycisphaeraceae bacterium]
MSRRTLAALVALNLALAAMLGVLHLSSQEASAQFGTRVPNHYKMIAGSTHQRGNQQVVYIIEEQSQRAVGLFFNSQDNRWETFEPANFGAHIERLLTGR